MKLSNSNNDGHGVLIGGLIFFFAFLSMFIMATVLVIWAIVQVGGYPLLAMVLIGGSYILVPKAMRSFRKVLSS